VASGHYTIVPQRLTASVIQRAYRVLRRRKCTHSCQVPTAEKRCLLLLLFAVYLQESRGPIIGIPEPSITNIKKE